MGYNNQSGNRLSGNIKRAKQSRRRFVTKFSRICYICKNGYIPTSNNQKFCGSYILKNGCSYNNFLKLKRIVQAKLDAKKRIKVIHLRYPEQSL